MSAQRVTVTTRGVFCGRRGEAVPAFSRGRFLVRLDGEDRPLAFEARELEFAPQRDQVRGRWGQIIDQPRGSIPAQQRQGQRR